MAPPHGLAVGLSGQGEVTDGCFQRNVSDWKSVGQITELPRSGLTDMWRATYPFSGQLFAFRGRRGDLVKVLSWDGQGLCLYAKRMEKGRFVWPQAREGAVSLTAAQLSMLLEGIDWRMPVRTWRPEMAG